MPKSSKPEFPVEEEDKVEIERIEQLLLAGALVVKRPGKALRHPLVVAARRLLRQGFPYRQLLQAPPNESCLDVRVSKRSLSRALAIMAAIIAILEGNGMTVRITAGGRSYGERPDETAATILGERVRFGVMETIQRVRVPDLKAPLTAGGRQRYETNYEPTGELIIRVASGSQYFTTLWQDTEQAKVESCVPDCIASMMKIAVEYRRNTAKRQQEELFRKLRCEELGQLKKQIEAEEARIQRLENRANDWFRARRIREYVLAVAEHGKAQGKGIGPNTGLGKWLTWAFQQADRIDPLAATPSSVLDRKQELEGLSPYGWP